MSVLTLQLLLQLYHQLRRLTLIYHATERSTYVQLSCRQTRCALTPRSLTVVPMPGLVRVGVCYGRACDNFKVMCTRLMPALTEEHWLFGTVNTNREAGSSGPSARCGVTRVVTKECTRAGPHMLQATANARACTRVRCANCQNSWWNSVEFPAGQYLVDAVRPGRARDGATPRMRTRST